MMTTERQFLEEYVRQAKLMQLATINVDGSPAMCNAWYDAHFAPDVLRFISHQDRCHSGNIRRDGRVSGNILDIDLEGLGQTVRGVSFTGSARELPVGGIDEQASAFILRWPAADEAVSPEILASGMTPVRIYEVAVTEWILFDEANYREQPRRVVPAIS